ncbi:MAG: FMN-binding negative transcriptional regulator [Alphaproteobacteria bacterium]|nr:FMN-binding negative transcriptional regulator [Alphaproteobacteria bacterium]
MYIPTPFRQPEAAAHALIEANPFGLLVVAAAGKIETTHLPFVLVRGEGAFGTLYGHVAYANPIWRGLGEGHEALVVFCGPNAYVSPDWYGTPEQVPTWNYVIAHASGPTRVLDAAGLEGLLRRLSAVHEARLAPKPAWTLDKLSAEVLGSLLRGIIGFSVEITRLEGKAKLGQNRLPGEAAGAVAGLRASADPSARAVAELMSQVLSRGRERR